MENNDTPKPAIKRQTGADHWTQRRKREQEEASILADAPIIQVQETPQPVENIPVDMTMDDPGPETPGMDDRAAYAQEVARIRATRKPFGAFIQKLALPNRPGYHRHWFNDVPGRIDEAKVSGWTHVTDKGTPVRRIVGTGRDKGALYAFAMEIPSIFWEEDMAAQHARAQAPIDAIKNSPVQSRPGTSKPEDSQKFYSPRDSILDIKRT